MRSPDAEALYHEIALQLHKADPKYAELEARPRSASRLIVALPCQTLKMKNPACAAVKREAEEDWGKRQ